MGRLIVVVGGQFGSEGKGAVVAHLTKQELKVGRSVLGIRVGGPNAGHTVYDEAGRRWPLRQVPVPMVFGQDGAIAAGSEVDPKVLSEEVAALVQAGHTLFDDPRLTIDPQATIIQPEHQDQEKDLVKVIGSTGKGIGAARAARIMREAMTVAIESEQEGSDLGPTEPTADRALHALRGGETVIIEGTQGFGLGLHAGYYPYCTSGDCRAIDVLAQAGLNPWSPEVSEFEVWIVMRTFPIRVAGDSGPLHRETTWETLAAESLGHIQPEKTTVTQKVRRVGRWDPLLANAAVRANGGGQSLFDPPNVFIALTMLDYDYPAIADQTNGFILDPVIRRRLYHLGQDLGAPIRLVGTGPQTMIDMVTQPDPVR